MTTNHKLKYFGGVRVTYAVLIYTSLESASRSGILIL